MGDFLEDLGKGMASTFGNNVVNGAFGLLGNEIAQNNARENFKYQWDNYLSPKAQVKNLAAAGLNPAAAMGNQAPVLSSAGLDLPQNPLGGIGTSSLADISAYLLAKANAKKAGADTRKADAEADSISFENELNRLFKQPERVANLMAAYKSLQLQDDEHSRNEWITAKEKALSQLSGIQKDTAQKVFDNMDTQIRQENKQREEDIKLTQEKQKTEKTSQSANVASANASNSQATVNRELARYQRVMADVEESASPFKLENLLRHYVAANMISDADYQEAYRRYERLRSINADNDKHEWNKALDAFMFYLEEHVKGLSPFVSAASTNYSTK